MSRDVTTKAIYAEVYREDGHDYGDFAGGGEAHPDQAAMMLRYVAAYNVTEADAVLEVGCGLARLSALHPGWRGIEYSATAIELAKRRYGDDLNIVEGDARDLPVASNSIDILFSFAALEHVPEVEKAFAEIERVVKPGGVALLSPAWNCRPWTVKKLQRRPYSELGLAEKLGKLLIPLRNNLFFRLLCSLPSRLWRELSLLERRPVPLDYRTLKPDFSLWERYGHESDDDAFVSIDAHAGIVFFVSRGWRCDSHPNFLKRFACRGEEIVVVKP